MTTTKTSKDYGQAAIQMDDAAYTARNRGDHIEAAKQWNAAADLWEQAGDAYVREDKSAWAEDAYMRAKLDRRWATELYELAASGPATRT